MIKRTSGKFNSALTIRDMHKYCKVRDKYDRYEYSEILQEVNNALGHGMIYYNVTLNLPFLGKVFLNKVRRDIFDKKGEFNKNVAYSMIDYKACYDLWKRKYGDLTKEEFKEIPNKPLVYYTNKIKVLVNWEKGHSCQLPGRGAFSLSLVRNLRRELAKAIKNPDVEVNFYMKIGHF